MGLIGFPIWNSKAVLIRTAAHFFPTSKIIMGATKTGVCPIVTTPLYNIAHLLMGRLNQAVTEFIFMAHKAIPHQACLKGGSRAAPNRTFAAEGVGKQ
jgi:hypothetical protein